MFQNEKIVEVKNCKHCNSSFEITDKDLEFYEKVSPKFGDKKYSIPTPKLCPDCRQQRRLSFRNERKLYKRKCDATGKDIISIYSPDKSYKVYEQSYWWSDNWNPLDYGKDFDFSKSFFEQFEELMREVPHQSVGGVGNQNSEYTNYLMNSDSCYMVSSGRDNKNCYYGRNIRESKSCIDTLQIVGCENSYELNLAKNCQNTYNSFHIFNCSNSSNLYFCDNCHNCFACINLANRSYNFFNVQYSPDEYEKVVSDFFTFPLKIQKGKIYEHIMKFPRRNLNAFDNQNFSGIDYVRNSNYVKGSISIANCENISYCFEQEKSTNLYDCSMGGNENSFGYEGLAIGLNSYKNSFSFYSSENSSCLYIYSCFSCQNCFGCIGLRNKSYCILNKQYTKEEYETLVPKIIEHMQKTGEWGEFFPSSISPFGYNETVAMEYFPINSPIKGQPQGIALTVENDNCRGTPCGYPENKFNRSTYEAPFPKVDKIIPAKLLPENIADIPDDILNRAIECEVTKKPFRIISQELEFYRKHNLPIPKTHPDQRHLDRMALRNPRKLFDRKCDKCGKDIKTTYSPERKEIVYCEECYNREVY